MSSIAYITDDKMLDLHRLNNHTAMNFWRISTNVNFSDFNVGDLVFFLSKNKEQMNNKEKGVVGFGRVSKVHIDSIKHMWEMYKDLNGYKTIEDFKEAIFNVSKDKSLPKKISSFYLENVVFFQPIYLSECGLQISRNVESYVYLKPEEIVINLLELAKVSKDLWTSSNEEIIDEEEKLYALSLAHKKIGDVNYNKKLEKRINKNLKLTTETTNYKFIQNSKTELYKFDGNELEIIYYHDKDVDERLLIGQAKLFKNELSILNSKINVTFRTTDRLAKAEYLMNE